MKLTLHTGALADIESAAGFYEREGSAALAARFVAEFKKSARLLMENPDIGVARLAGRRSFPMSVFPYSPVYRASAGEIRILIVKHDRMRPGYGRSRK